MQHYLNGCLDEISQDHGRSTKGNTGECLEDRSGIGAIRGRGSSHAAGGAAVGRGSSRIDLLLARGRARGRKSATSGNDRSSSSKNRAGLEGWVAKAISGRNDRGSRLAGGLRSIRDNLSRGRSWGGLARDNCTFDHWGSRCSLNGRLDGRSRIAGRRLRGNSGGSGGQRHLALGTLDNSAVVHGIHEDT